MTVTAALQASLSLEAARENVSVESLRSSLEELDLAPDAVEGLARVYGARVASVREVLAPVRFSFATLVDVDWRLDYYMKSKSFDKANVPFYFVTFTVREPSGDTRAIKVRRAGCRRCARWSQRRPCWAAFS